MYMPMGSAMRIWDRLASVGWQCSLVHKPYEDREIDRWVFHGVRLLPTNKIISFSVSSSSPGLAISNGEVRAEAILRKLDSIQPETPEPQKSAAR